MFNDILNEASIIRENALYIDTLSNKSLDELRYEHSRVLRESAICSIGSYLSSTGTLTESITFADTKSLVNKLIESFKQLVISIVKQFIDKLIPAEKQLNEVIKKLKTKEYLQYEIETFKNIKNIGSVIDKCKSASNELKGTQIDTIIDTVKSQSLAGKIGTGYKLLNNTLLDGYVKTFKAYNNDAIAEIKRDLFGPVVMVSGIEITKFSTILSDASNFKTDFSDYSIKYEAYLKKLETGISLAEKTNAVNASLGNTMTAVLNSFSAYFNRNVNLIMALVVSTVSAIMSTANKMARI